MESTQNLQRRMKSVQNIGQITKAMELVAATKMRRSQELALSSRPYAYTALEMLGIIANLGHETMPELLTERPVEKTVFLVIASDKGLAGSFNGSVFRKLEHYIRENAINLSAQTASGEPAYIFVPIGQKAKSYLEHRGYSIAQSFLHVGDYTRMEEVNPIAEYLIKGYLDHHFDAVVSFSTNFVSALRQEVLVRPVLPVSFEKIKESIVLMASQAGRYAQYLDESSLTTDATIDYVIEPSPYEVLESVAHELMRIRIYHMILEANASEHSARRMAMKNASDNASELSENLNIQYNKSRQAAITNQIIEVTSGAQAMQ
jgi:F-type H+-transporting ATPase subunit gamma